MNRVLGRVLAGVACLAFGFPVSAQPRSDRSLPPSPSPGWIEVIAHRGASRQAPENTHPALARCVEDGFEWAEVDVRRTADGHHVLWHDGDLARMGHPADWIASQTVEQLRQVDAGAWFARRYQGERMLTLPDALALARGRLKLYLDCKDVDLEQLAGEIRQAGMDDQVVIYEARERLAAWSTTASRHVPIMTKWHPADGFTTWVTSLHPEAVEIDAPEITADIRRSFQERGIKVQVKALGEWDTPESWGRAVEAGADWLQTDRPEEVTAWLFHQRRPPCPVQVSYHRGAARYAPENTLSAFQLASRMGADFVEFDVRTTRDGVTVLLHDRTLDRTTSGRGPLAEATFQAIVGLDAGAWFGLPFVGTRVPTLEAFFRALPDGLELYCDAKAISAEALADALARHRLVERTVVYQSVDYLRQLRTLLPGIRILPPLRRPEDLEALAAEFRPYAVDAAWEILSKPLIDRCHALGIRVFSDALGENERPERYRDAVAWGIDVIQTDHPLRVYRALAEP